MGGDKTRGDSKPKSLWRGKEGGRDWKKKRVGLTGITARDWLTKA